MDRIKFFYDNLWRQHEITPTSEHVNFPATKSQHRDFNKMWHSNHGPGSGWGNFLIVASVNDRLDFEDNGTTTRAASLTPGEYDADELAAHIETQMEASGTADTFTVEYLESSNKFKITDDAGSFELLWNTGANKARSIATTIGFSDAADDTGADNYTADSLRIHSEERLSIDLGTATDIYAAIIRGHNFTASASVKVEFSADNWATVAESLSFTIQAGTLVLEWDTPKNYRYVRIWMRDRDNADLYVAVGVIFIGDQYQPEFNFMQDGEIEREDPSEVQASEHGQEASIQIGHFDTWTYDFFVKATGVTYFDVMFDMVGKSKPLFICEDPDLPLTTTKYVAFSSWRWRGKRDVGLWTLSITVREQR